MSTKKENEMFNIHDYNINIGAREIYLYDEIDCESSMKFLKNLNILESISKKPIVIHQYSTGGEWSAGMVIYDAIKNSDCSFLFITHGCAASMGSVIPQSVYGKGLRLSSKNCDWLIHEGYLTVDNTTRAVTSVIDFEKNTKSTMYDIYTSVCESGEYFGGQTPRKIKNYIRSKLAQREDWWLTSSDAVFYGFADGILGSPEYKSIKEVINAI